MSLTEAKYVSLSVSDSLCDGILSRSVGIHKSSTIHW